MEVRVGEELVALAQEAAVDQRLAREQSEPSLRLSRRGGIRDLDLKHEPRFDRRRLVGLIDAVAQSVGQHAPGNTRVADGVNRLSDQP